MYMFLKTQISLSVCLEKADNNWCTLNITLAMSTRDVVVSLLIAFFPSSTIILLIDSSAVTLTLWDWWHFQLRANSENRAVCMPFIQLLLHRALIQFVCTAFSLFILLFMLLALNLEGKWKPHVWLSLFCQWNCVGNGNALELIFATSLTVRAKFQGL